jgi:hypothetical protein
MSYFGSIDLDRTCADADEDARLDARDGLHTHAIAAWIASNAKPYRLVTIPGVELGGCAACGGEHDVQQCGEIRTLLFQEDA